MKNEYEVFKLMQSGDWESFGQIFEKYSAQLYAYAYAFVREKQEAEDIIQDTFAYLWSNRERIRWNGSIYGYLFRSVKNACLNHQDKCRRNECKYRLILEASLEHSVSDDESHEELHALAMRSVANLPERCREIFIMDNLDGLSHADISEKMGISVNTVKTHIRRARHKLHRF